ncbi:monofunctional biosynthetic peptidoglycan transglycosylase [Marinobacter nanhaiticus D15-8W]|uniref:Biosynthetic peptidoglycan transglycosylase n=1 Tax=Marinobacter nanhaiticus D15-8W TaxID=626887 RepID=N6X287_9GAMM|nr:monofunctional biosynthetic peptidoglycan transglycosylase [Marinobacter nanhaiticus]ENO15163.1 monofunctional biosynthetic peptidoglycan transglycosylase [Marinobacter nanhaiticus D15-8W]BES69136.1 monofunctional biosynthetic peptidoglycan transglycosylase [Marinobacter nanhaiticus D15-8W]
MAGKSGWKRIARWLLFILLGVLAFIIGLIALLRFVDPPTTAFMMADRLQYPERRQVQNWVDLEDISPWMPLAVIASEDQRFLQHWGLDLDAIASAVQEYREGEGLRGASTISQQTTKNLFLWNGRQMIRKGLEAGLTLGLEALWSKRRIMEVYLNVAEFGDGVYGVEAASRRFFGIPASQLSASQAARLAAVLPNPKAYSAARPSDYIWQRVDWITGQMYQLGGPSMVRELTQAR